MLLLRGRRCKTFELRNVHITISVLRNDYYEVFITKYLSYDFGGNPYKLSLLQLCYSIVYWCLGMAYWPTVLSSLLYCQADLSSFGSLLVGL